MSLVNDMLEDLDRRAGNEARDSRRPGLEPASGRRKLRRVVWICVAHGSLALCGIAAVSWMALASLKRAPMLLREAPSLRIASEFGDIAQLPSVASAPPAPPAPSVPAIVPLPSIHLSPISVEKEGLPPRATPERSDADFPRASAPRAESVSVSEPRPKRIPVDPPSDTELATELIREGEQLLAARRLDAGLVSWQRALALDPAQTTLYLRAARQLLGAGLPGRAESWLERGRAAKPLDPTLRSLSARVALQLDGTAAALSLLEAGLPALSDASELHSFRAALLQREQRHLEALDAYRNLVAAYPDRGRLWFGLAVSADALGRIAEANIALHHALDDPELSPVLARHADLAVAAQHRISPALAPR